MTRRELIISDKFWEETIDNLLFNHLMGEISKKKFIKKIVELKNEIIKEDEPQRENN